MSRLRRRSVQLEQWGVPERDSEGRAVCRWCRGAVRPPRRTFCGPDCVHEWRVRSDVSYVREQVWKRDAGRCRICATDLARIRRAWGRRRPPRGRRREHRAWRAEEPRWEADHIVPVADGGGLCGLENYRLLCRACHRTVTREWRRTREACADGSLPPPARVLS